MVYGGDKQGHIGSQNVEFVGIAVGRQIRPSSRRLTAPTCISSSRVARTGTSPLKRFTSSANGTSGPLMGSGAGRPSSSRNFLSRRQAAITRSGKLPHPHDLFAGQPGDHRNPPLRYNRQANTHMANSGCCFSLGSTWMVTPE